MRLLAPAFVTSLLLSACCPLGYTDSSYYEWEGPGLSSIDVAAIKADCDAERRLQEQAARKDFYQKMDGDCKDWESPHTRTSANSSTGEKHAQTEQDDMRNSWKDVLCPDWRERRFVPEYVVHQSCHKCSDPGYQTTCYQNRGLREVRRSGLKCKALSW